MKYGNIPIRGRASGSVFVYHWCQSLVYCSNVSMTPWKPPILSISVMLSHTSSGIHAKVKVLLFQSWIFSLHLPAGLSIWFSLSKTTPPFKRKLYSASTIFPSAVSIFTHIWKEKSSLCCSNSALQVFLKCWNILRWYIHAGGKSLTYKLRKCDNRSRKWFSLAKLPIFHFYRWIFRKGRCMSLERIGTLDLSCPCRSTRRTGWRPVLRMLYIPVKKN